MDWYRSVVSKNTTLAILYRGTTLAIFHSSGKEDRVIAWLKVSVSESEITGGE